MASWLSRQTRRRKWLVASMVTVALIVGLLCVKYRRYGYAVAWHCVHGNYAAIGGRRVRLPLLWWKERVHAHDTPDMLDHDEWLARACPSNTILEPEIETSPTILGEGRDTDQEELKSTQSLVSTLNHNSVAGSSHSLVILTPRPLVLYCMRTDLTLLGVNLTSMLTCHAAGLTYSFSYNGPPTREKEAESILSTLE